jgi:hypothetical protein
MNEFSINDVVLILQVAIAPVVWISGIGMLILSQANRMAHIMDRIRHLQAEFETKDDTQSRKQVHLLFNRAKIVRISLIALLISILFDAMVMINLFVFKAYGINNGTSVIVLFSCSLVSLIVGLVAYIIDVNKNLNALSIEVNA